MNILVVNAFGNSAGGKEKFNSFLKIIKNIFKIISQGSVLGNFNYIIRTPNTISDYIFNFYTNPEDETADNQNRKNFNSIDMVFIDGYETYVPWQNKSSKLCEFVKLCKLANKVLYAGGVALEILVYYLATGGVNENNLINGKGELKAVEEIDKIPLKYLSELKKRDNFLDYVTGDILEYRQSDQKWIPVMNIGLHHQMTSEKYFSRGKYVLPDKFKGKDYLKNKNNMLTIYHELKVSIIRQVYSHYLVKGLPPEFITNTSLTWFPHFFNVTYKKYQFQIICESDKGPVVIEHENTIGVAFHTQENSKESCKLLENFMGKKFHEVQEKLFGFKGEIKKSDKKGKEVNSIFKMFLLNDMKKEGKNQNKGELINRQGMLSKVDNSRPFNRIKKVPNEANHVGHGLNNRDMIFVENNFISQKNFNARKIKKEKMNNNFEELKNDNDKTNYNNFTYRGNYKNTEKDKKDNNENKFREGEGGYSSSSSSFSSDDSDRSSGKPKGERKFKGNINFNVGKENRYKKYMSPLNNNYTKNSNETTSYKRYDSEKRKIFYNKFNYSSNNNKKIRIGVKKINPKTNFKLRIQSGNPYSRTLNQFIIDNKTAIKPNTLAFNLLKNQNCDNDENNKFLKEFQSLGISNNNMNITELNTIGRSFNKDTVENEKLKKYVSGYPRCIMNSGNEKKDNEKNLNSVFIGNQISTDIINNKNIKNNFRTKINKNLIFKTASNDNCKINEFPLFKANSYRKVNHKASYFNLSQNKLGKKENKYKKPINIEGKLDFYGSMLKPRGRSKDHRASIVNNK